MIWILLAAQGSAIDVAVHGERVAVAEQGKVEVDGRGIETSIPQIAGIAFAPDGALAVFGGRPGSSGEIELVGRWRAGDHADMVNAVAFGPDWVATGSHDRTIVVRDRGGRLLRRLEGHTGPILALAAKPDGSLLVSAGIDRTLRVWDPRTGELKRSISNHGDRVGAMAFSPDGRRLASGSRDRTVRIWEPEIGRLVKIVRGHEGEILDLAWGERLVSACSDGMVRVLDEVEARAERELDAGGIPCAVAVAGARILATVRGEVRSWER
jgi:WD40 repeat protein